jgi:hypothetical protein
MERYDQNEIWFITSSVEASNHVSPKSLVLQVRYLIACDIYWYLFELHGEEKFGGTIFLTF